MLELPPSKHEETKNLVVGLQAQLKGVKITKTKRDRYHECFLEISDDEHKIKLLNWSDKEIIDFAVQILLTVRGEFLRNIEGDIL